MNSLVSELAIVAAQEKAMLDEYEALLASTAAMQVKTMKILLFCDIFFCINRMVVGVVYYCYCIF